MCGTAGTKENDLNTKLQNVPITRENIAVVNRKYLVPAAAACVSRDPRVIHIQST